MSAMDIQNLEWDLAKALKEWRDAGGPVMDIIDINSRLIDAKIELAMEIHS